MSTVLRDDGASPGLRAGASGLARARRWVRHVLFPQTCKARLPLEGVAPGLGDIHAGGTALLLCADPESRRRLIAALRTQLEAGAAEQEATWLCAANRAPWFDTLPAAGAAAVRARGALRVLAWSGDAAEQVRTLGPAHLLRELLSSGMRHDDLLVVDLFEPWLDQDGESGALERGVVQALACLEAWSRSHRGPILALAPAQWRGQPLLPLVAPSRVPRLARLRAAGAGACLEVLRWGAAHRSGPRLQGLRIELDVPEHGAWRARASQAYAAHDDLRAADARHVLALSAALHDATSLPEHWQGFDHLDALLQAARSAVAATVVLAFEQAEHLGALAHVVHRLRQEHPRQLRIVVREAGAALRQNGELALTRVGANAVLHAVADFHRLEELVEDLREQAWSGSAVAQPERLLQHLLPDACRGVLAPADFCAAAERMLERTAGTPLEHTLVHLPLLPHVSHADAVLACVPRRDGDLVSLDERGLVLFLFGCPADDAMAALDALFSVPCSELARHVHIDPDRHTQRLALAELQRQAAAGGAHLPLAASRGPAAGAALQPVALPTRPAPQARHVHAHVLPLRAAAA